uniref:EamA domain-containing protein n=1 Tax=Bicosoecida sp. CB-2014 TaxID=1486930 RepID=A0A7S1C312_9STRA|mmetsp:Transcript_11892/g.41704  ORF Transcript_11892/g.41704 Transcript_11892/m.41704 type:complete len:420 (+) Transcript_11892:67-1326(+)
MVLQLEDKAVAFLMMVATTVLLGSWPSVFKVVERRGMRTEHAYLDYSPGNFVVALALALTVGNMGAALPGEPNFSDNLVDDNARRIFFAALGGATLCIGNLLFVFGIGLVGVSIAQPLQASLTVVFGTTINYLLQPDKTQPLPLFIGILLAVVAIVLGSLSHSGVVRARQAARAAATGGLAKEASWAGGLSGAEQGRGGDGADHDDDGGAGGSHPHIVLRETSAGALAPLIDGDAGDLPAGAKGKRARTRNPLTGILVCVASGLVTAAFSPLFNLATNAAYLTADKPLTVYTAFFYFSAAFGACSLATNLWLMYRPPFGGEPSTVAAWCATPVALRLAILGAGVVCGTGNALQFVAGKIANFAASDIMAQANPLVGAFYGLLVFHEYDGAPRVARWQLAGMFASYLASVVFVALSFLDK